MGNTSYTPEEPIAAIATALSPSALGIIRTSGRNSIELVSKIFSRPKALLSAQGNSIVYGWIKNKDKKIDEVLISVFKSPKSFTGEDMVEISCHGGVAVVTEIFNLLLQNGFRVAERGEFTFRKFINGKTDLTRAEAIREIIEGRTVDSTSRAAGRLAGNLYEEISLIKKIIVDTLASIEVEIEYPEDEENISDSFDTSGLEDVIKKLHTLCTSWKSEKLYQEGARIVLCGKTNAGKSSLFNSLLKEDRAIVSNIEGTTRDWIESWISIDGIPARLFDTAGLRNTNDVVELKGLESTKSLSSDADIILYIADASQNITNIYSNTTHNGITKTTCNTVPQIDLDFITSRSEPIIFIWNKIDLLCSAKADSVNTPVLELILPQEIKQRIKNFVGEIKISAKDGQGLGELTALIKSVLLGTTKSEREQAGLGSARQKKCVEVALECVQHAMSVAQKDYTLDAVVQDLEDALDALAEVTGETTPDDVLESIFSHFCVGK